MGALKSRIMSLPAAVGEYHDSHSLVKRIGINSLWLLIARVSSQGMALLFTALVARQLGEVGLGQYAFIASVVFVGNMITTFGMDTLLIREIAKTRDSATPLVPAALWIQLVLSAIFIAIVFLTTELLSTRTETLFALRVYALSLAPLAFYTIFSAILRAFERMDAFLALNLVTSFLQVLAAFLAFSTQASLTTLVYLLLATQIASALLAGALGLRLIPNTRFQWRIARKELIAIARVALPFAILVAFGVIYQRIALLLLPALASDAVTGWFSAAARIVEALKFAPQAVLGALFPLMSRWAIERNRNRYFRVPLLLLTTLGALAALGVTLTAQPLIDLIYGARFAPSIAALQVLAWSLIPYAFTATVTLELLSTQKEWRILAGNAVGVGVAVLLYVFLVPNFGLLGASWAALASEWVQAGVFFALRYSA